ncbi:hypothetical protein T484DRAFT_1913669 [Baffinella frigidus]|nr:hypothetical protein T484DRAFT_1913669 [Cryptophyta sp. CCMP2293]
MDAEGDALRSWLQRGNARERAAADVRAEGWKEEHAERFFPADDPREAPEQEEAKTNRFPTENYIGPTAPRAGLTEEGVASFFQRLWLCDVRSPASGREVHLPGRARVAEMMRIAFARNRRSETPPIPRPWEDSGVEEASDAGEGDDARDLDARAFDAGGALTDAGDYGDPSWGVSEGGLAGEGEDEEEAWGGMGGGRGGRGGGGGGGAAPRAALRAREQRVYAAPRRIRGRGGPVGRL